MIPVWGFLGFRRGEKISEETNAYGAADIKKIFRQYLVWVYG